MTNDSVNGAIKDLESAIGLINASYAKYSVMYSMNIKVYAKLREIEICCIDAIELLQLE